MSSPDLSFLDRPEILELVFVPRKATMRTGSQLVRDYLIEVEPGVNVGCRFYMNSPSSVFMLYFHGSGEIVDDCDSTALVFNQVGINLFVASYRGYGFGNGTPTVTNMIKDSHKILKEFRKLAGDYGSDDAPFVMGYSLGSLSAMELALHNEVQGLIIESGPANSFRQYVKGIVPSGYPIWNDNWEFHSKVRIRSVSRPTLIIHGEQDTFVPPGEARELYDNAGAKHKQLEMIAGGDHNNLFTKARDQCLLAIEEFVRRNR